MGGGHQAGQNKHLRHVCSRKKNNKKRRRRKCFYVWASDKSASSCQKLSTFLEVPGGSCWLPRVVLTGLTFGGLVHDGLQGCNVQQQSQLLSVFALPFSSSLLFWSFVSPDLVSSRHTFFSLSPFFMLFPSAFFFFHLHLIFTFCPSSPAASL